MSFFRRNKYFVRVPSKIGDKSNCRIIFGNYPPAVLLFHLYDVLKKNAAELRKISPPRRGLVGDRFEYKIVRVDLAMRVRVRYTDRLSLVLKDQNVFYLRPVGKIKILFLPRLQKGDDLVRGKLGQCQVMARAVTHDP